MNLCQLWLLGIWLCLQKHTAHGSYASCYAHGWYINRKAVLCLVSFFSISLNGKTAGEWTGIWRKLIHIRLENLACVPLACLPRSRPFSLAPSTSKRLLRRLWKLRIYEKKPKWEHIQKILIMAEWLHRSTFEYHRAEWVDTICYSWPPKRQIRTHERFQ